MGHQSIESIIGENVARYREARGWKQSELGAEMERSLGRKWERGSVWAAETGKRAFAISDLLGLADALGVQVPDLLKHSDAAQVGDVVYEADRVESLLASSGSDGKASAWSMLHLAEKLRETNSLLTEQYVGIISRIERAIGADDDLGSSIQTYLTESKSDFASELLEDLSLSDNDTEHLMSTVRHEDGTRTVRRGDKFIFVEKDGRIHRFDSEAAVEAWRNRHAPKANQSWV